MSAQGTGDDPPAPPPHPPAPKSERRGLRFEPTGDPAPREERDPPSDPTQRFHRSRWRKHKMLALLLGALGGGLAGWANTTLGTAAGLPLLLLDPGLFLVFLVVLVAPVVEEHVKVLTLVLLRTEERATYTPRRWLVLGAFAGAGFGLAEAIFYWQLIAQTSVGLANLNLGTRLLLTVPMHALTVTATGYGYGRMRQERESAPMVWALAVAIVVHAAFNAFQILQIQGAWP